jgi:ABC-2 type transport system permease protein
MTDTPTLPRQASFSLHRIGAVLLRHWYLQRRSWPRLLELVYWPSLNIIIWGFLQTYLMQHTGAAAQVAGTFLGAVLIWETALRGQIGVSVSFFEEVYSRNLGHLLVTPLSILEFATALAAMSFIRTAIAMTVPMALALWYFGFSAHGQWLGFGVYLLNLLIFGWSVGFFVSGLVMRYGLGAESFAWGSMFLFVPLCGVYYPVTILPGWAQAIAAIVPPSYVFEGLRHLIADGTFDVGLAARAFIINMMWLAIGAAAFIWLHARARDEGRLLHIGE